MPAEMEPHYVAVTMLITAAAVDPAERDRDAGPQVDASTRATFEAWATAAGSRKVGEVLRRAVARFAEDEVAGELAVANWHGYASGKGAGAWRWSSSFMAAARYALERRGPFAGKGQAPRAPRVERRREAGR